MSGKLDRSFYVQATLKVARQLLGKFLVRETGKGGMAGKIVETEAYVGPGDKASHVKNGQTERNKIIFGEAGRIYIYLVYGMYWQLNITTAQKDEAECVLIRALEPAEGIELMQENRDTPRDNLTNGPGKLCQALLFDKKFYGEDLTESERVWVEDRGVVIKKSRIISCPRIGIDYAGKKWAQKPWRFYIKNNSFVSAFD